MKNSFTEAPVEDKSSITSNQIHPLALVKLAHNLLQQDQSEESPLTNSEKISNLIERASSKNAESELNYLLEDFLAVIDETFPQISDDSAYFKKTEDFKDYIKSRWGPQSEEPPKDKLRLIQSTCNLLLRYHTLDKKVFTSAFPPEVLLCFKGTSERADTMQNFNDYVSNILHEISAKEVSKSSEIFQKTVPSVHHVHANAYLRSVLGLTKNFNPEEYTFVSQDIDPLELLEELFKYPLNLLKEFTAKTLEKIDPSDLKLRINQVAQDVLKEFKKGKTNDEVKLLEGWVSESGGKINLAENLQLKTDFEEALTKPLLKALRIQSLTDPEEVPIFINTADDGETEAYSLSLNYDPLISFTKIMHSMQLREFIDQALKESAGLNPLESLSAENSALNAYSKKSLENIKEKLLSQDEGKNTEAVNILFALSKSGKGSALLHIFNHSILNAAKILEKNSKSREFKDKSLALKLNEYLKRADLVVNYLEEGKKNEDLEKSKSGEKSFSPYLQAQNYLSGKTVNITEIPDKDLLFFIYNLSTEDALDIISKITATKLMKTLASESEFGKGLSFYTTANIAGSMLSRADYPLVLTSFIKKTLSDKPDIAEVIFSLAILSQDRLSENVEKIILEELKPVDLNQINPSIKQNVVIQQMLIGYLKKKHTHISNDSSLLKFISILSDTSKNLLLIDASSKGHEEIVKHLLDQKVDVNSKDRSGISALMFAAQNGHEKVVEALVNAKVNINYQDQNGNNALISAAAQGHHKIVELLVNNRTHTNNESFKETKALSIAATNGHKKVVNLLMNLEYEVEGHKTTVGLESLMLSAKNGSTNVVKLLLELGVNFDGEGQNTKNISPLIVAAIKGHEGVVKLLVNSQASINKCDNQEKNTPLMMAAYHGHEKIVNFLVESNAEVDSKNAKGFTALMLAKQMGHKNIVKALITAKNSIVLNEAFNSPPPQNEDRPSTKVQMLGLAETVVTRAKEYLGF